MEAWGLTDTGNVREENQDFYRMERLGPETLLAVVCDGMGGARAGNVASELAVKAFSDHIRASHKGVSGAERIFSLLREALARANRAVYEKAQSSEDYAGMGTTLVAAIVSGEDVLISNVGDSRAYLLGSGGIQQISKDHSLVGSMVEQGNMTEQEARRHPNRNLITRALGPEENVRDDEFSCKWKQGDYLLLCTDGLVNTVSDQELLFEIVHTEDPEHCLRRLVDISVSRGAPDNITAILMQNI